MSESVVRGPVGGWLERCCYCHKVAYCVCWRGSGRLLMLIAVLVIAAVGVVEV